MRYFMMGAAIAALMSASAMAQQLSVDKALEIKENAANGAFEGRAEWGALTFYFQGVIEGAAAYQQALADQGKAPLFCPPQNKGYSIEEMFRLLSKAGEADRSRPASRFVLEAYARAYPCDP